MSVLEVLELVSPEDYKIPDWAPVVSFDTGLGSIFGETFLSFDEIAQLVEDEDVPKEELKNLRIHFTNLIEPIPDSDTQISGARFISCSLINDPESYEKYKQYLKKVIGKDVESDLEKKSFILVNVPANRICDRGILNPIGEMCLSVNHELLHFTEYVKREKWWEEATDEQKLAYNREAVNDPTPEEVRVVAKELEIIEAKKYGRVFLALFIH